MAEFPTQSEVAEFPTPVGAKGLRSFLGLANYFHDHVRHYAGLEISGSEEFVTDACALVFEFRDIFSTELSPEPADLPP